MNIKTQRLWEILEKMKLIEQNSLVLENITLFPEELSKLGLMLAQDFLEKEKEAEVVATAGMENCLLGNWVTFHLNRFNLEKKTIHLFLKEKRNLWSCYFDLNLSFRQRLFVRKKEVLVVDIGWRSGNRLEKILEKIREHKGKVVGIGTIFPQINDSGFSQRKKREIEIFSLIK